MQRILLVGTAGSGKTRLSVLLSQILTIPVTHWDTLYYSDAGTMVPDFRVKERLNGLFQLKSWIIDGSSAESLERLCEHADTVILIDACRWRCSARLMWRALSQQWKRAKGCKPALSWAVLKDVLWDFPMKKRQKLLSLRYENSLQSWYVFPNYEQALSLVQQLAEDHNVSFDQLILRPFPSLTEEVEKEIAVSEKTSEVTEQIA